MSLRQGPNYGRKVLYSCKVFRSNRQAKSIMKIIVIGGTGHIGTFLCPMLASAGHEVICVSRGTKNPYQKVKGAEKVRMLRLDRSSMLAQEFAQQIVTLEPDVVIDLINFKVPDVIAMVEALRNKVGQYIYCSSCWAEGRAEILPTSPDNNDKEPLCEYGKEKYSSEEYLLSEWKKNRFPVTIIMPGQISGPGWIITNPWGCYLMKCNEIIKAGEKLMLPNFGMETLHHVHAEDVARLFACAVANRNNALGEKFYAVSGHDITLYGYARLLFKHYGKEVNIGFLSWNDWTDYVRKTCAGTISEDELEYQISQSFLHLTRSGYFSIEKERRLLGYSPKYTNVETILMSVDAYDI